MSPNMVAEPVVRRGDFVRDLWVPVKDQRYAEQQGNEKGDVNAQSYMSEFGRHAWEVDTLAMDPEALRARIVKFILAHRNDEIWETSLEREAAEAAWLRQRIERLQRDATRRFA